jgi:hypothetical protein
MWIIPKRAFGSVDMAMHLRGLFHSKVENCELLDVPPTGFPAIPGQTPPSL